MAATEATKYTYIARPFTQSTHCTCYPYTYVVIVGNKVHVQGTCSWVYIYEAMLVYSKTALLCESSECVVRFASYK